MTTGYERRHRGFILPVVLVAVAAASMMVFALTSEGLQALRGTRGVSNGFDAASVADAASAHALLRYDQDSVWSALPGISIRRTVRIGTVDAVIEWRRQQPLVASLRAVVRRTSTRPIDAATRDVFRAVRLSPPAIPVVAALSSNGVVTGREGTLISGADLALPGSPCGLARDTASVGVVAASAVQEDGAGRWPGAPVASPASARLLTDLQAALDVISSRLPPMRVTAGGRTFPVAPAWSRLHWRSDTVIVVGPTRWTGLVVVRGAMVLVGDVQLEGLLLVEGSLDATAANLAVQGAVIAADTSARGVMLGANSRLFYDRCAVQMALATVARPSLAPFSLWHSLPR